MFHPSLYVTRTLYTASCVLIEHTLLYIAAAVVHPFFVMFIDREKLLQTALQQIMAAADNDLIKPLRVVFVNEEAIDEGGVRKEFFQLLVAQLFSPDFGMDYTVLLSVQSVCALLDC
jgi:hypothetical protein